MKISKRKYLFIQFCLPRANFAYFFLTVNSWRGLTNDFFLRSCQLLFCRNFAHFRHIFIFPVFFWKSNFVQNFQFSPYHYHSLPLPFITIHHPTLPCITLHYPELPWITLHYSTLLCIILHYPSLPYPALPCITLHYPPLTCITLHYPSLPFITLH